MKEKELSPRMKNLYKLTRVAVKYELTISKTVFKSESLIEEKKALYDLKYDSELNVFEKEDGEYIILTIIMKGYPELLK